MPAPADDLAGLRVIVARPAGQSEPLCALLRAAGAEPLPLPLQMVAEPADSGAVAAILAAGRDADWWIFSSTNAVRRTAALLPPPWPRCAAVGPSTAEALRTLGLHEVLFPHAGDGAAALLAEPAMASVGDQKIVLIAGENPLPLLAETLSARGAVVIAAAVYRRVAVDYAPETAAETIARADAAIVPSGEALQRLVDIAPLAAHESLRTLQLVVPSARVADRARQLGFERPALMPDRVSDAAYLDVLRGFIARRAESPTIAHD